MRKVLTTAVLLGLLAAPILAQGPGGGRGGNQEIALLANKGVQDEIKLTDKQKESIAETLKKLNESRPKDFKDKEAREKFGEESKKVAAKIKDELKSEQKKRLEQISIQVAGTRAFAREEVQAALKLTDKQKDEIKEITTETGKDLAELFKSGGRDKEKRAENQAKIAKLNKEAMEKISKTLNDNQKKAWKELTGEHFDYKPEFGGGGRRPEKKKDI